MPLNFFSKFHNVQNYYSLNIHVNESSALYLTHSLRALALGFVGVFLPIYILEISTNAMFFSSSQIVNGLIWIMLYFFLRSFFVVFFLETLGSLLFTKINFHRGIFISFIVLIAEILCWMAAKSNIYFILIAGVLAGLKVFLYWIPYHIYFVKKAEKEGHRFASKTSFRFFYNSLMTSLAPLVGGIIITTMGFNVLFVISIILLLFASYPILYKVSDWEHSDHKIFEIEKRFFFNKRYKKLDVAYIGEGIESIVTMIFWPVLLFMFLDSFVKFGFLNSVTIGVSALAILLIGKVLDKHGYKKTHGFGVGVVAFMHLIRTFLNLPFALYSVELVDKMNASIYSLPIMSITYDKAKKYGVSDFIIYRELTLHLSILCTLAVLIIILPFLGVWRWVFLLGAVGAVLTYFLDKEEK